MTRSRAKVGFYASSAAALGLLLLFGADALWYGGHEESRILALQAAVVLGAVGWLAATWRPARATSTTRQQDT